MSKIKNRLYRLLPSSVARTHWKTGLFTPNANSSPGSRNRLQVAEWGACIWRAEFDFVRHLETVEDLLGNLCLVLV